jgi:hypothetical protein
MHTLSCASGLTEKFCRSLATTAVALVCLLEPASGQSVKILKLGYILSTDSQLGAGGTVFADEIAKRTKGRHRVEQYPNAALGGEVEMLKALQPVWPVRWAGKPNRDHPILEILSGAEISNPYRSRL